MPSLTRREALAAASSSLLFLAGCSGTDRSNQPEEEPESVPVEYEFERVRSTSEPILFRADEPIEQTVSERRERYESDFVARKSNFEDVEFASTAAGQRLQSFGNSTDFETEALFLYSTAVSACHGISLESVTVDSNGGDPHLDFCQFVRPADVECSVEELHTVGYAVRLPIDGTGVTSSGTGMSHGCHREPEPTTFDTTVTVQDGDGT